MTFNSMGFILFFGIFILLYYLLPKRAQTAVLLVGSYVFFLWGNAASGWILASGTLVSYAAALCIQKKVGKPLVWLWLGQLYVLGLLFIAKYLGFFSGLVHLELSIPDFLSAVGISFFTFGISGYLFDVWRGKLEAETSLLDYAAFVSFFPAILAGPIGRARDFLPQLKTPRPFDLTGAKEGFLRFLVGCVKKMVLADSLGILVDRVFEAPEASSGLVWGFIAILYAFQIYYDFSAYSDMAIGIAKILGFRLTENFHHPYYGHSVKEFWKGWHISLTSWFREYLYFPLGGSREGKLRCYRNILIVFAVSGLWHGAAGHFILWGLLNGMYQVVGSVTDGHRDRLRQRLHLKDSHLYGLWRQAVTFGLITVSWVFFRAASSTEALFILKKILFFFREGVYGLEFSKANLFALLPLVLYFAFRGLKLLLPKAKRKLTETVLPYWLAVAALLLILSLLGVYGEGFNAQDFVYFKF